MVQCAFDSGLDIVDLCSPRDNWKLHADRPLIIFSYFFVVTMFRYVIVIQSTLR